MCYSQMNTSDFQVHFLSFSRNQCTIYRKGYMLQETMWLYSGYQEQLGASGMQIQYNYVTLYTKRYTQKCFFNFDAYTFRIMQ